MRYAELTSISQNNTVQYRVNSLVFWYAFLMAFPAILVIQNISVYLFPLLLIGMFELTGRVFNVRHITQVLVIAFGIGAICSTFNISEVLPARNFTRALDVLPNYLYWVALILFLTSYSYFISLNSVYKGIFWGLICSVVYYFLFGTVGQMSSPFLKVLTQNTFAFLLICFAPMVIWYTGFRYGNKYAIAALVLLSVFGFLSGSRSGSLLVLSGGIITLVLNRKKISSAFLMVVFISFCFLLISTLFNKFVKDLVNDLNPRTYSLIYENKLSEDRSYLVRLAQIEKALIIFDKYPITGIGLNNFGKYKVKLVGNFEGAQYVIDKKKIDEKSAHNSYFGLLAEGGLVLFIPFVLLLFYCIFWFFLNVSRMRSEYKPVFIGIIHMSIHLYFIYAILNVFSWFLIGLGCLIINRSNK